MCDKLVISTNAPIDLNRLSNSNSYFVETTDLKEINNLKYPHAYRLAMGNPEWCGCGFRVFEEDLVRDWGFEWYSTEWIKEEFEDKLATFWLFQIIKNLVNQGYQVDSYMAEHHMFEDSAEKTVTIQVNKTEKTDFVFYHCVRYEYVK